MKHKRNKLASSGHGGSIYPDIPLRAILERDALRLSLKKRSRRLKAMKRALRHGKNMEEING